MYLNFRRSAFSTEAACLAALFCSFHAPNRARTACCFTFFTAAFFSFLWF